MAAITAINPTTAGVLSTGTAVSASDTVNISQLGPNGGYYEVLNAGASPDNVSISDSSLTDISNPATVTPVPVANGTSKVFFLSQKQANLSTGNITITHSFQTSVTCKLYPC